RTKQGGNDPEQEQHDEQERHGMQDKAEHGYERNPDLGKFEPLRHGCLVVTIGKLSAERGEEEIRRDEDCGGQRDQCFGVRAADVEQDKKDQRILEEIIAECREELAPEQGGE